MTSRASAHRRAQVNWELAAGASLAEASAEAGLHYTNAHHWARRFLEVGVDGLYDQPRSGRPRRYGAEPTAEILKVAMARPGDLGLGFTTWSLPKLEEYLREEKEMAVTRSTIRRRLQEAGLRFRAGQAWCRSTDPDFEVKKPNCDALPTSAPRRSGGVHGRNGTLADHPPGWPQLGLEGGASPRPLSAHGHRAMAGCQGI